MWYEELKAKTLEKEKQAKKKSSSQNKLHLANAPNKKRKKGTDESGVSITKAKRDYTSEEEYGESLEGGGLFLQNKEKRLKYRVRHSSLKRQANSRAKACNFF